jgi:ABC-2 type transport system ATP-binding protein
MMDKQMINFEDISKSFGKTNALKNVNFEIKEGEIFGLLGPNGAGKTTSINILSTILKPDAGNVWIDGLNLRKNQDACKLLIGVVPQEISLYEVLSAYENLFFWGSLYHIPPSELEAKIHNILQLVGLYDRRNDAVKTYSGGMKRRINIASAILHNPKILLMDEPTVGIDPQSRNRIFEIIQELNQGGMTIIYTTHYMEEAERLCNTIAIIDNGSVIAKGSLDELKKISETRDILKMKTSVLNEKNLTKLKETIHLNFSHNTTELNFECKNISIQIPELIHHVLDAGIEIHGIETQDASLESVFLKLTGKHLRD